MKRLGTVHSVKVTQSGLAVILCIYSLQRERVLHITCLGTKTVTCFALRSRALLKVVLTGVELTVEEDQLKWKIPGLCDSDRSVQRRPGGECSEMENTLFVLLSFDAQQGQIRMC